MKDYQRTQEIVNNQESIRRYSGCITSCKRRIAKLQAECLHADYRLQTPGLPGDENAVCNICGKVFHA